MPTIKSNPTRAIITIAMKMRTHTANFITFQRRSMITRMPRSIAQKGMINPNISILFPPHYTLVNIMELPASLLKINVESEKL
jgi:hypothetical protein